MSAIATLTAIDTLPKELTLEEYPLVYEISRRSASQWKQKNPDPRKQAKVINSSKINIITMRSRWNGGPRVGNVDIQYVPGAPTIFKRDYVDASGTIQPGLEKLYSKAELDGEQYRRAVQLGVQFVDGYLFLENFGGKDDPLLAKYIYLHAMNEGRPDFKMSRDLNAMFVFKPFMPEKKAELSLEHFDLQLEALNLLGSVRNGKGVYNQEKLNALMGIFNLGGFEISENAQKMQALALYLRPDPTRFLKTYTDITQEYRMTIGIAQKLGIIAFTSKDVKMKIGAETRALFELKGEKGEDNTESLVYYLLGDEKGKQDYSMLCGEVDVKKVEALKR